MIGTAGVITLSVLQRVTWRRICVLTVLGLVGMIGLAAAMDTLINRFTEPRTEIANKARRLLIESSWEMFKDYPLGVGWNNFAKVINYPYPYGENFDRWTVERGYAVDRQAPKAVVESLYWLLLAETGFSGLLCFLAFVAWFLWWNLRAALFYKSRFLGCLSLGILLGCTINYLQSYFERVLMFECNMMLWLIMLALTAKIETWRRQDQAALALAPSQAQETAEPPGGFDQG